MKFLTRIIIILSLLNLSCDESNEIGIDELLSGQKNKIRVHYVNVPLNISNIYLDSVRTDEGDVYFGKYSNPNFGDVQSISYAQLSFQPGSEVQPLPGEVAENYYLPNESSILDSAVLYLKYSKVYGEDIFSEQEITISQIQDTLFSSALYTSSRYVEISPPLADIGFTRFKTFNMDTFLTIPIKDFYGKFILNQIVNDVPVAELVDRMRGLAFVPGENNSQLVSFNLDDDDSKLILYFNNPIEDGLFSPVKDSLQYIFRFNSPITKKYSYYDIDRSASELSFLDSYNSNEKFNFQDKIYWHPATGIYPVVDLENFHNFLDTAKNIVLNKVELVTGPIDEINNFSPPSKALYYILRNNNLNPIGIISNPVENVVMRDNAYYSDESDAAEHALDSIVSFSYKGESTVFFQELAMGNLTANELITYPELPNTFDNLIMDKDKVFLKIYYTKYKE